MFTTVPVYYSRASLSGNLMLDEKLHYAHYYTHECIAEMLYASVFIF